MQGYNAQQAKWQNLGSWLLLLCLQHCIACRNGSIFLNKETNGNIIAGKIGSPSASRSESGRCIWVYLEPFEALAPPFFAFLVSVERFHHSQITQLHREANSWKPEICFGVSDNSPHIKKETIMIEKICIHGNNMNLRGLNSWKPEICFGISDNREDITKEKVMIEKICIHSNRMN